jgi:hypothetical protein
VGEAFSFTVHWLTEKVQAKVIPKKAGKAVTEDGNELSSKWLLWNHFETKPSTFTAARSLQPV